MLKMYEEMVASGAHSKLDTHELQLSTEKRSSENTSTDCPMSIREFGAESTNQNSVNEKEDKVQVRASSPPLITMVKQDKKPMMGCPFFNKELTDPEGKNITQGYP